jgi:hypothetical protein
LKSLAKHIVSLILALLALGTPAHAVVIPLGSSADFPRAPRPSISMMQAAPFLTNTRYTGLGVTFSRDDGQEYCEDWTALSRTTDVL